MKHSLADENYLKAIFHLSGDNAAPVSTGLLAEYLNVSSASVTDKIKRLGKKDWVHYQKSRGVLLTQDGRAIALSVIRKHRLWEQFLVQVLGFGWDEVHEIAEQLEHVHSGELVDRIDRYLDYPAVDPHGDPIPDEKGKIDEKQLLNLAEVQVGQTLRIAAVANHDNEFLKFLDKKGLMLHCELTLRSREAYDGSITLSVGQEKPVVLSGQVAKQIWVEQRELD